MTPTQSPREAILEAIQRLDDGDGAVANEIYAQTIEDHALDTIQDALNDLKRRGEVYQTTEGTYRRTHNV